MHIYVRTFVYTYIKLFLLIGVSVYTSIRSSFFACLVFHLYNFEFLHYVWHDLAQLFIYVFIYVIVEKIINVIVHLISSRIIYIGI